MLTPIEKEELATLKKRGKYDRHLDAFLENGYSAAEVTINNALTQSVINGFNRAIKRCRIKGIKVSRVGTRIFLEVVHQNTNK